jgi:hypothetical protein
VRSSAIYVVGSDQDALSEKIARFFVSVTLMLSIVFPTTFTNIKMGMLFAIFFLISGVALKGRLRMAGGLYCFSLLYVGLGFVWSMYGAMVGTLPAFNSIYLLAI